MSAIATTGALSKRHVPQVAIVIPVYRNAATLAELSKQIATSLAEDYADYQIVFVVDASPDASWQIIRQLARCDTRICGILLSRNQGQHDALMVGLRHVRARWVAVMDADLQDPPALLPALLDQCARERITVFAVRGGRYQSVGRMITSRLFKYCLRRWIGLPANAGSYFVVPDNVAEEMRRAQIRRVQVVVMAWLFSHARSVLPYARNVRAEGKSAYSSWARMKSAMRSLACVAECRQWIRNSSMRDAVEDRVETNALIADQVNI